jgi:hypothetical protein
LQFAWLVTFHAGLTGWMQLAWALHLRRHKLRADLLAGGGLLSFAAALGVYLLRDSAHRLLLALGIYAVLLAFCLIGNALQLRSLAKRHESAAMTA